MQKENSINTNTVVKKNQAVNNKIVSPIETASAIKQKSTNGSNIRKDSITNVPVINNEAPVFPIADNKENNNPELILLNEQPIANNIQPPFTNKEQPAIASVKNKTNDKSAGDEYLSLRELAAQKIKEKTLDEQTIAAQKKNGRSKRFTGWDVAQIVTRGISKVTGRNVEVKPTYNDEGAVTAYALGNGIEHSKGR